MFQIKLPENYNFLDVNFDTAPSAENLRWIWVSYLLRDTEQQANEEMTGVPTKHVFSGH